MKIIGHRGARGLAPENTLVSLQKALEHQVDMVEFDLRVTRDGVVILHHDKKLTDPNGDSNLIKRFDYSVLKQHKPDLTTLEELIHNVDATQLYLEVKPNEPVGPIVKILKEKASKNLILGSKSHQTLLELHAKLPEIQKIVIHPWSGIIATRRAKQVDTKLICMNQRWLWRGFISSMSKRGWRLLAYTLNDPKKAARWKVAGLYAVVTDYPDRFEK